MGPLSNSIALWLGIRPADIFLYIFLPPLLLDSAVRMDFFTFRKARTAHLSGSYSDGCVAHRAEASRTMCLQGSIWRLHIVADSYQFYLCCVLQVLLQVLTFAFLVVIALVVIMVPVLLYVFRLTVSL